MISRVAGNGAIDTASVYERLSTIPWAQAPSELDVGEGELIPHARGDGEIPGVPRRHTDNERQEWVERPTMRRQECNRRHREGVEDRDDREELVVAEAYFDLVDEAPHIVVGDLRAVGVRCESTEDILGRLLVLNSIPSTPARAGDDGSKAMIVARPAPTCFEPHSGRGGGLDGSSGRWSPDQVELPGGDGVKWPTA